MHQKIYDPLGNPVVLSQFRELRYILSVPEKVVEELNDPTLIIPKGYKFVSTSKGGFDGSAWDNYNAAIAKDPIRKLIYDHYMEAIGRLMYMYILDEVRFEKEITAIHAMGYKIHVYVDETYGEFPSAPYKNSLCYIDSYRPVQDSYFTIIDQRLITYQKHTEKHDEHISKGDRSFR